MSDEKLVHIEAADGVLVAEMLLRELTDLESGAIYEDIVRAARDFGWDIVVDCTRFETLSSSGIGMFVKLQRLCEKNTGSVAMCGLGDDLLSLLRLTRMDGLFTIAKTREEAIQALRRSRSIGNDAADGADTDGV